VGSVGKLRNGLAGAEGELRNGLAGAEGVTIGVGVSGICVVVSGSLAPGSSSGAREAPRINFLISFILLLTSLNSS